MVSRPPYDVGFTNAAVKQLEAILRALTDAEFAGFAAAFQQLQVNPYPNPQVPAGTIRHLGGPSWRYKPSYRYRIVYSVVANTVTVEEVLNRKDAYRLF